MTHPDDLLAGSVDGALTEDERAALDAHLQTCERCREELALARDAVRALGSLDDAPVPFGVTGPVLREAGAKLEHRGARWQRVQWVAGIAAAVALVVVIGLNVTGSNSTDTSAPRAAGAAETAKIDAGHVRLEREAHVDYDGADGVRTLAQAAVDSYRTATRAAPAAAPASPTPEASSADAVFAGSRRTVDPGPALRCLQTSQLPLDAASSTLVRLVEARFSGTPAYFAVFLQGPGAGQPPQRAVVWVVARDGCSLLNATALPF